MTAQPIRQVAADVAIVTLRRGDYAMATPSITTGQCAVCGGTGLIRGSVQENGRAYDVMKRCECSLRQHRAELFNAAQIPAVHAQSTFENYRPRIAQQDKALSVAKQFAHTWSPTSRGFILSGPVGTGKTHLLSASLRYLTLELGIACSYVEISLLYSTIRRGFQEGKSGGEIIGPLSRVEVLAIDELGKGRGSPFEMETLDELIARRYNAGKITLFATNYSLKPPEEKSARGIIDTASLVEGSKDSKNLSERVGDRIYSRLCDMCEFVELPGGAPDARRTRMPRPPQG